MFAVISISTSGINLTTNLAKEFQILSLVWVIYRAVVLCGFFICLVMILLSWTWAIQRQWTYGSEVPDLVSIFTYLCFLSLVAVVGVGVKYIPLAFKTRARHIEYQNYLELEESEYVRERDRFERDRKTSISGMDIL
jgi:formate hydrogenlyase subunit 3/multisubunit Na+/H+ antiporter MnhD subunit